MGHPELGPEQGKRNFARRFHKCSGGVDSPEIHSWCWGEKAVVTAGFTAPAPGVSPWITSPLSYPILTPVPQLPARALSEHRSHPIPSLLFVFFPLALIPQRFLFSSFTFLYPDTHLPPPLV